MSALAVTCLVFGPWLLCAARLSPPDQVSRVAQWVATFALLFAVVSMTQAVMS